MASMVDIWNLALNLVGGKSVTDPNENSTEADLCRLHYPFALDFVLESQDWNFAVKRQEVAESSSVSPVFGFNSSFKIPADALRVIEVWDNSMGNKNTRFTNNNLQWQQEGEYISADTSEQIWIRYITRIEDTARFSASFATALSTYLAYRLAIPIAANRALKVDLLNEYQLLLSEAAANDGMTGRTKALRSNVLISARFRN
jgi:hypothetical protein